MANEPGYIVVIGASAGGFNATYELVRNLEPEADAAYFIVLHLSTASIGGFLAHRIQEYTKLKCRLAEDGLPIEKGTIYVAVPNYHLIVTDKQVKLSAGPKENRWRPSIDVLFRVAAAYYSNRVIGVVLTGLLNDGTSGMSAIKRVGGKTLVQDPNEAEYPDMPLSVLNAIEVDHCVHLSEMGKVIGALTREKPKPHTAPIPDDLVIETRIFENLESDIRTQLSYGSFTPYTCGECGGTLFRHDQDAITKFKCHIGHSYTIRDLMIRQSEEMEDSLWIAIRSLEQRKNLLEGLVAKYSKIGSLTMVNTIRGNITEIENHIANLKGVITSSLSLPEVD